MSNHHPLLYTVSYYMTRHDIILYYIRTSYINDYDVETHANGNLMKLVGLRGPAVYSGFFFLHFHQPLGWGPYFLSSILTFATISKCLICTWWQLSRRFMCLCRVEPERRNLGRARLEYPYPCKLSLDCGGH